MRRRIIYARVVFVLIRIVLRAVLGVANRPKIVDVLLARLVGVQRNKLLALLIRDDVNDVPVEPALILFRQLGFLRGRGELQAAEKRNQGEDGAVHIPIVYLPSQRKRRS